LKEYSFINYTSDWNELQNQNGKFNLIVANAVLHHLISPEDIIHSLSNLLKPGGIIIFGHEPYSRYYQNNFLKAVTYLFRRYKRVLNQLGLISSTAGSDIISQTYETMRQKNLITDSFDKYYIPKLVDIHVPVQKAKFAWGQVGFTEKEIAKASGNKLQLQKIITYNHIKDDLVHQRFLWKIISNMLSSIFPLDGADAIFCFKKVTD
jgi:SAM-dependent methyltransferase